MPLILLHQSPLSSTQFDAVLPLLADLGFSAVALDLPGFGASDPLPPPVTLDAYAALLAEALRHFEWPRVAVVGHHTGAVIGAWFAASRPESISRLVLNGFPLLSAEEQAHFATFDFRPKAPQRDGSHLLTAWHNRLRSTPGWVDIELMHRYTVEGLLRGQTNWMAFPLVLAADLAVLLKTLVVPTLLLTNTGEDLYAATRRSWELRPEFFHYEELSGGTHDIIDEQPHNWARVVGHFLVTPRHVTDSSFAAS